MESQTLSSKYQVVIPKPIRERMQLRPGQKIQVIEYDGAIRLVPLQSIQALRGAAKGIDPTIPKEQDRF